MFKFIVITVVILSWYYLKNSKKGLLLLETIFVQLIDIVSKIQIKLFQLQRSMKANIKSSPFLYPWYLRYLKRNCGFKLIRNGYEISYDQSPFVPLFDFIVTVNINEENEKVFNTTISNSVSPYELDISSIKCNKTSYKFMMVDVVCLSTEMVKAVHLTTDDYDFMIVGNKINKSLISYLLKSFYDYDAGRHGDFKVKICDHNFNFIELITDRCEIILNQDDYTSKLFKLEEGEEAEEENVKEKVEIGEQDKID